MESNRAIIHDIDPNELKTGVVDIITKPVPEALPGRVVVKIILRPINPTDLISPLGRHGRRVNTPGLEGLGVVHSVGEGVTKVKLGQRVVPFFWESLRESGDGSWQEYVSVREEMLTPVPDSVPDEVAAQFVLTPWTIVGMMRDLDVPRGDYLLQTAAGSVLGRQIIQLAKYRGIKTINVVRREEQKEELKALGADEVICSTTEDIVSRVKEITNDQLVYGALDCVGGELTKSVASCVRRGGTVFLYGVLSGFETTVLTYDLLREVTLKGWLIMNYWEDEEHRNFFIEETWKLLEAKVMEPLGGKKFPLSEFRDAIQASEAPGKGGKVFLA